MDAPPSISSLGSQNSPKQPPRLNTAPNPGSHLEFGGDEDGGGADELQLVLHAHHLHQVVVHQLHRQVQRLVVQLKVLLQGREVGGRQEGLGKSQILSSPKS